MFSSCGFSIIAFGCELINQSLLSWLQFRYLRAEFEFVSYFLPTFLIVLWCLFASALFPYFSNLVVVWGNFWTYPLLVGIGYGVECTIRQICSFYRARWCIAVIVSSRLEFWYRSRCELWCFASWNLGGNFLQNLGVFLAVAAIIDFYWGHKNCQFCIVQFRPQ